MTVGPPEYADDMPTTDAQIGSIKEDIRALSDTVSEILSTETFLRFAAALCVVPGEVEIARPLT